MKVDIVEPDNYPFVIGSFKLPRKGKDTPEDMVLMPADIWFNKRGEGSHFLIGILDGMSNPAGGGYASDFTASNIRAGFYRDCVENLGDYLYLINEQLIRQAKEKNYPGSGTTLALAEIDPITCAVKIYSAGDSAIYLFSPDAEKRKKAAFEGAKLNTDANKVKNTYEGYLEHLKKLKEQRNKIDGKKEECALELKTLDSAIEAVESKTDRAYSELEKLRKDGEYLLRDIYSGKILNPIDSEHGLISNHFGSDSLKLFTGNVKLNRDNYLIICSDGVANTFTAQRMAEAIAKNESLEDLCKFLVEKSLDNDDRSVVILHYF